MKDICLTFYCESSAKFSWASRSRYRCSPVALPDAWHWAAILSPRPARWGPRRAAASAEFWGSRVLWTPRLRYSFRLCWGKKIFCVKFSTHGAPAALNTLKKVWFYIFEIRFVRGFGINELIPTGIALIYCIYFIFYVRLGRICVPTKPIRLNSRKILELLCECPHVF